MKEDHTGFLPLKVILLGGTNVGKTSLISRYLTNTYPLLHDITIAIDFYQKTLFLSPHKIKLEIWDTFGIISGRSQALDFASKSDCAIFVFDLSSPSSFEDVKFYIEEYKKIHKKSYGVLVGNKKDKSPAVAKATAEALANANAMDFFIVSAKDDESSLSIGEIFETVAQSVLKGEGMLKEESDDDDINTNEKEDKFVKDSMHYNIQMFVTSMSKLFPVDDFVVFLIGEMNEYYKENIVTKKKIETFNDLKSVVNDLMITRGKLMFLLKVAATSMVTSKLQNDKKEKKSSKEKNKKKEKEDDINNFLASNQLLRDNISTTIYSYIMSFIRNFVSAEHSQKKKMILASEEDSIEGIKMKRKELNQFFNDDYVKYRTSADLHEYFQFKTQISFILSQLNFSIYSNINGKEMSFYKEKGDAMLKILKQYRYAFNDKWNKVTQKDIKDLNFYQIEDKMFYYGYKAFLNFKTAYEFADTLSNFDYQVSLRADVAYTNYLMGFYLKANFYILSGTMLMVNHLKSISQSTIHYVLNIVKKISKSNYTDNSNDDINKQLNNIHIDENMLTTEDALNIKMIKKKIYRNIFLGLSYLDNEFSTLIIGEADDKKKKAKTMISGSIKPNQRNVSNYLKYLVIPGLVAYGVMRLVDKYTFTKQMKQFHLIKEKLYSIYTVAVDYFKKKQYKMFLSSLTETFTDKISLIKYDIKTSVIVIEPSEMTSILVKYGFNPDDIVNLLNLIGIALLSNISSDSELKRNKKLAIKIFKAALNENLLISAEKLDCDLREQLQLKNNEKLFAENIEEIRNCVRINLIMLLMMKDKERTKEYIDDIRKATLKMRFFPINEQLEASEDIIDALYGRRYNDENNSMYDMNYFASNIDAIYYAKIDNAIYDIALFDLGSFIDEFVIFNTITKGVHDFSKVKFVNEFENRCNKATKNDVDYFKAILDAEGATSPKHWKTKFLIEGKMLKTNFLSYISKYYNVKINIFAKSSITFDGCDHVLFIPSKVINDADSHSSQFTSIYLVEENENLIFAFMPICRTDDDISTKIDESEQFSYTQKQICLTAMKYFNMSTSEKKINDTYYKVLFKLGLFKELVRFIVKDKIKTPLQYKYLIKAEMRLGRYDKCVKYMKKFLKKEKIDSFITHDTLQEIIIEKTFDRDYVKYYTENDNVIFTPFAHDNKSQFRILCIDGGGIRMLIQILFLCEIERITHQPIAAMFDMIAGTSTGGIIASALCLKNENGAPLFKAAELLSFILDNQDLLFYEEKMNADYKGKYSFVKKRTFLSRMFSSKEISNSLSHLVIPCYNTKEKCTELFTSYTVSNKKNRSNLITQILEISTATPTLFPFPKIKDVELCDAVVSAFSPSIIALNEAVNVFNINKKNIRMLSLGSGEYPLMTKEILVDGVDQTNFESHIRALMNNGVYHRVDVVLSTPVRMDDVSSFNELMDIGRESIVEMKLEGKINQIINDVIHT